jgi:DNA mismatch repair protein MutS2
MIGDHPVRNRVLAVGMNVRLTGVRRVGELLSLPDGRGKVRVRMKNATVEVDAGDLRAVDPGTLPVERERAISLAESPDDGAKHEIDLRGMTTDEASDAIEVFVSTAIVAGFARIWIIHGKGTGALREKTHEVLKALPVVKSFRLGAYGEGDTGVTVAELGE